MFEDRVKDVIVDNMKCKLHISDTAGQEDYDRLRPLAYPGTDVFLLCFALNNSDSLRNIQDKWMTEIQHHRKKAKIILVGLKKDLR